MNTQFSGLLGQVWKEGQAIRNFPRRGSSAITLALLTATGSRLAATLFIALELSACTSASTRSDVDRTSLRIEISSRLTRNALALSTRGERAATDPRLLIQNDIGIVYGQVMQYCADVLSKLEVRATQYNEQSFYIALLGTVAGAVVSPALTAANASANAAWTAGLSGLAGATNTLQKARQDVGLTGSDVILTRETARQKMVAANDEYSSALASGDETAQNAAIAKLFGACALYEIAQQKAPTAGTDIGQGKSEGEKGGKSPEPSGEEKQGPQ